MEELLTVAMLGAIATIATQLLKELLEDPEDEEAPSRRRWLPLIILGVMPVVGVLFGWELGESLVGWAISGFLAGAAAIGYYHGLNAISPRLFSSKGWLPISRRGGE